MMRMIMAIRACKLIAPYISFTHIIWSRLADKLNNLFNTEEFPPLHPLLSLSLSLPLSLSLSLPLWQPDKDAHTSFITQGKAGKACQRRVPSWRNFNPWRPRN